MDEECSVERTCDECKVTGNLDGYQGSNKCVHKWFCANCWNKWQSNGGAGPNELWKASLARSKDLKGPVFVVGLPKCGTTSLQHALESCGYGAVHCYAPKPWGPRGVDRFVGHLMAKAAEDGLKPLDLLPNWVNCVTQMDCWWVDWEDNPGDCFGIFPQITLLDNLDEAYPDAKFILCHRDPRSWVKSVETYGPLRKILTEAELPGLPKGQGASDEELCDWFQAHVSRVRRHFEGRKTSSFIEFALEDGDKSIREKLELFLGVPVGWGHHNVTTWA